MVSATSNDGENDSIVGIPCPGVFSKHERTDLNDLAFNYSI